jgi:hypothetical protein
MVDPGTAQTLDGRSLDSSERAYWQSPEEKRVSRTTGARRTVVCRALWTMHWSRDLVDESPSPSVTPVAIVDSHKLEIVARTASKSLAGYCGIWASNTATAFVFLRGSLASETIGTEH